MNTFGEKYRFTSFGESHGPCIGGVLDGVPSGVTISLPVIVDELARRAGLPGLGTSTRALHEPDIVEWLSGVVHVNVNENENANEDANENLVTLGTPIAFIIRNKNIRPEDYAYLQDVFRPGHADYTYHLKYGVRDARGGGRASARETAARVVAGAILKQQLTAQGTTIHAELEQIGGVMLPEHASAAIIRQTMEELMQQYPGDSFGGVVRCTISGLPAGTGEPVFGKLQAELAAAMFSIPACKGFEYGLGFASASMRGSEANAVSGGIAGGISDGSDIIFRVAFKPTPSIALPQQMMTASGEMREVTIRGRHDRCVAIRAVAVVEAMTAIVLAEEV